jgi:nitrite reductase/ring-hydroxylating ferredoxin subunit
VTHAEVLPVAALAELPSGTLLSVTLTGGEAVCLANVAGAIYAFVDECPHAAFPMSAGDLLDDGTVRCAWHGARFDARTGAGVDGQATRPLALVPVRVADGQIFVDGPHRPLR